MTDSPTLMSIKEMIDAAFGDPNANVVNHKLIHAVLIILARQIRLLERRVEVDLGPLHDTASATSLNVTEVKMYANVPKKKKQKQQTVKGKGATATSESKSSSDRTSSSDKTRPDSREEQKDRPTPMASMNAMEKQYEKLLIVERVPKGHDTDGERKGPRLSIVTQEEFAELTAIVKRLQKQYFPAGTAGFPENAQLLEELRRGASLTDAMAALQLSARLEAAEKTLEKMLSLVTDLAKNNMRPDIKQGKAETKTEVLFGEDDTVSRISTVSKKIDVPTKSKIPPGQKSFIESKSVVEVDASSDKVESEKQKPDWITAEELDNVMQDLYNEFMEMVNTNTAKSNANANSALKIANRLGKQLDESLNLGDRMYDLEKLVSQYAEHINTLDTAISSQITNYQEQLTQMQHDLEVGIETMQEALTNTGGDTTAVAELNTNFTNLQVDFDIATMRQKELREIQNTFNYDLQALWKQIEILRDEKSDRDEVADALRDKAGIAALNGLVSRPEFDAVRGDFEKRIGTAYDKFNNQEVIWQKAIDELLRELSEKADWLQVVSLQESIAKYLERFNEKIKAMMDIVGEPRAAAVSRKLHREATCLSCNTPAHMNIEEHKVGPSFPAISARPPGPAFMGAEAETRPSQDGDHRGVCYPGLPIPHPIDPRSHICRRYCGGSHTMTNNTISRIPPDMIINRVPFSQECNTSIGTDGKTYVVDQVLKPCKACCLPEEPLMPKEAEPAPDISMEQRSSGMTPSDYFQPALSGSVQPIGDQGAYEMSMTPPAPIDSNN